jgi:putative membrane protein
MLGMGNPLADHMAIHILSMNLVAPLAVLAWRWLLDARGPGSVTLALVPASVAQVALLWGWHMPSVLEAALANPVLHLAMQASLLVAALWFWAAVFDATGARRWRAVFALLVTGKLFCLLGILLVFAPRTLYAIGGAAGHLHGASGDALQDQQLAGLLMITACPLTYVLAGVVIAARWLLELDAEPAANRLHLGPAKVPDAL